MGNTSSKTGHSKSGDHATLVVANTTKPEWNLPKIPCACCGNDKDPNADPESRCDCSGGNCPARWLHESTNLRSASRRKGPKCGRCVKHCLAHEGLQFQLASTRGCPCPAAKGEKDEYVPIVVPPLTAADLFLFCRLCIEGRRGGEEEEQEEGETGRF
ncbi:hypothetical protein GE09DRAFT_1145581 [Coniochaeta sp. 2T2.1]|nr:hypothetical protein GE09DRAFT_1145581 [Coniochaeta sp. 2T2.1]